MNSEKFKHFIYQIKAQKLITPLKMYYNNSRSEIYMLSFPENEHANYRKYLLQSDYLMKDSGFIFYVEYLYIINSIIFCKNIKAEKQHE